MSRGRRPRVDRPSREESFYLLEYISEEAFFNFPFWCYLTGSSYTNNAGNYRLLSFTSDTFDYFNTNRIKRSSLWFC